MTGKAFESHLKEKDTAKKVKEEKEKEGNTAKKTKSKGGKDLVRSMKSNMIWNRE